MSIREGGAVAGQRPGVGGDPEHPAESARCEEDGLRPDRVQFPVGDPVCDDAGRVAAGPEVAALGKQVDDVVLVVELDAELDALLVERLENHVAGSIDGVARPPDRPFAEVAGVAAEAALVDPPIRGSVERQAHVLEFDHGLDRLARQDLGRVLVNQVVAALDRVEHVPFPVVFLLIAESRADAALRGSRVGSRGIELRHDRRIDTGPGEFEGGPEARSPGADDQGIVLHRHGQPFGTTGSVVTTVVPRTNRTRATTYRASVRIPTGPAARVVDDHGPDAHEPVEEHEHQERPVEDAPEQAAPADLGDPRGVLLGRVIEDVQDQEVGQREDEQPEAGQAHQEPDRELQPATGGPRPTDSGVATASMSASDRPGVRARRDGDLGCRRRRMPREIRSPSARPPRSASG